MCIHHYLKTIPLYFNAVNIGAKTFEVRFNDRNFKVGDIIHLQEYIEGKNFTGNEIVKEISYILDNKSYCKEGYVILALK
jgi:ASC-1-like (ASCH) protein